MVGLINIICMISRDLVATQRNFCGVVVGGLGFWGEGVPLWPRQMCERNVGFLSSTALKVRNQR